MRENPSRKTIADKPVYNYQQCIKDKNNIFIVSSHFKGVIDILEKDNNNYIILEGIQDTSLYKGLIYTNKQYIVMDIVGHCNLNYKGCGHFSPTADKYFYCIDEAKRDLQSLSNILEGQLKKLRIMGGEPLLHPNVVDILRFAREVFPQTNVVLITNGTLLLKQEVEFWNALKDNNIELFITKYPINFDYDAVEYKASQYNINLIFDTRGQVIKTLLKFPLDIEGKQNAALSYSKCKAVNCVNLFEGKLYQCPTSCHLNRFNKKFGTNMQVGEGDYLELDKVNDKKEVFKFISTYKQVCKYCMIDKITYDHPFSISKKEKEEWLP
ncbi:MAG: hypothetical protein ATN35_09055 [Epulopiscium sp. Nele67-Bin004]|nr:MAG: hypothetical protein ATN35_09055 [Epulopiscium sp. Nele67-Bin004]